MRGSHPAAFVAPPGLGQPHHPLRRQRIGRLAAHPSGGLLSHRRPGLPRPEVI